MKKLILVFLLHVATMYTAQSVTIFIHGSQNATKLLSTDIWYCQQGLHHITELPNSSCFVKDAQLLVQADNNLFNLEHYYTFGWSGKVSFRMREKAGQQLFKELQDLVKEYKKKYDTYPVIRIITNSHGGNIALNMMQYFPLIDEVSIQLELITLACPVQKVTSKLIEHSAISRSYVIYSTFDLLQLLDFYKYEGRWYFPKRTFATDVKNCTQVLVKVNGHRLTHTDFAHSFVRHIPQIIQSAQGKIGHIECNITDPGFVFYNGFNINAAMKAKRKI